jgi:ferric-dicitrate binding protein FerR (iron transport regulator)
VFHYTGGKLMTSKTWSRKPIAALVAIAVWSVYSMVVLAAPGTKAAAELSVSGHVAVNGEKVSTGGTVFSDSTITTEKDSTATVNISKLGHLQLGANSSVRISFADNTLTALLETGTANVSTLAGVTVNLTTKEGSVVVDGSQATSFTVSASRGRTTVKTQAGLAELRSGNSVKQIAAGTSATAGTPTPQDCPRGDCPDTGMSGGALAVLLLGIGGAVAAIFWAITHDNDLNFGGTVVVVSPTK